MLVLNSLNPDPRVWKEARTLAESGYKVTILAMRESGQKMKEIQDGIVVWRIFEYSLYGPIIWNTIFTWIRFLSFIFGKKRESFDICHCHDAETLLAGYLLTKKDRARLIYDVHELAFSYIPLKYAQSWRRKILLFFYRFILRLIERVFIKKVEAVITVNHSLAGLIQKYYKLKEKPFVIYNSRKRTEVRKTDFIRSRTGIPNSHKILFYQGMIRKDRELERIIRLLPMLDEQIVFVVAGMVIPKEYFDELSSLADELSVKDRFYYIGFLDYDRDLLTATASADIGIFLLPGSNLTYKYSLANKFFDYLMAARPIVTSNLPEMKEIIKEYQIGFSVDIEDQESFVRIIHRLTSDEILYDTIVKNMERAKKDFCWEHDERKLIEIYKRLEIGQSTERING